MLPAKSWTLQRTYHLNSSRCTFFRVVADYSVLSIVLIFHQDSKAGACSEGPRGGGCDICHLYPVTIACTRSRRCGALHYKVHERALRWPRRCDHYEYTHYGLLV